MIRFIVPVIWLMLPAAVCTAAEWPELIEVFIDGKTRIQGIRSARSSGANVQRTMSLSSGILNGH